MPLPPPLIPAREVRRVNRNKLREYVKTYGARPRKIRLIGLERLEQMSEEARGMMLRGKPTAGGNTQTRRRYQQISKRMERK